MNTSPSPEPGSALPPDDPRRTLTVVDANSPEIPHVSIAGDTYTILVTGQDTGGRYCLIDMHVPQCGGPPAHRHDFEEMFTLLEGEIEFSFRGETITTRAGTTVNIPANAPHSFKNTSGQAARMLCLCAPAGQEAFFLEAGDPADSRTSPPPALAPEEMAERRARAMALMPAYRTELVAR